MCCIVLIGGVIGSGKTELINFILKNRDQLFDRPNFQRETQIQNCSNLAQVLNISNETQTKLRFCVISFDELCSIEEQANLMKTIKGMKNFRNDVLEASEHFISSMCNPSCLLGPISSRSHVLLEKLKSQDCSNDATNTVFLVEDNFYYRSMRYEWFQIARRVNMGFCQVFVTCPLDIATQRNNCRSYQIPEDRIKRIFSCLEYPDSSKYKWEKHSVIFDSTRNLECCLMKEIVATIEKAQNNPAEMLLNEEKKEAQIICSKNVIHQADRIIRKLTSKKISFVKETLNQDTDLKTMVSVILKVRQKLLADFKQNSLCLPKHLTDSIKNLGIDSVEQEFEDVLNEHFEKALILTANSEHSYITNI